jgi:hypothetical protein
MAMIAAVESARAISLVIEILLDFAWAGCIDAQGRLVVAAAPRLLSAG